MDGEHDLESLPSVDTEDGNEESNGGFAAHLKHQNATTKEAEVPADSTAWSPLSPFTPHNQKAS